MLLSHLWWRPGLALPRLPVRRHRQREEKAGGAQCRWLEWCAVAVRAVRRRPHAARAVIERDFAFRGNSAAYLVRNYHDHGPGRGDAGQSGRNGHVAARRDVRGAPQSTALRMPRRHSGRPRLPGYAAAGGPNHMASASGGSRSGGPDQAAGASGGAGRAALPPRRHGRRDESARQREQVTSPSSRAGIIPGGPPRRTPPRVRGHGRSAGLVRMTSRSVALVIAT